MSRPRRLEYHLWYSRFIENVAPEVGDLRSAGFLLL
jgi:hypothetical protein